MATNEAGAVPQGLLPDNAMSILQGFLKEEEPAAADSKAAAPAQPEEDPEDEYSIKNLILKASELKEQGT
jgi:hypothetical protein